MTAEDLNHHTRGDFEADAFALEASARLDAASAWKLVRTARFGIQLSQDPLGELTHYAERVARICLQCKLEPEAFAAFEALLDSGMRPQTDDPYVYTVRAGEPLTALAERFGVTVPALMDANPVVVRSQRIGPGMRLQIPDNLTYVVQRGETLESVTEALTEYVRCFDDAACVTAEDLRHRRRNELVSDEDLVPGQALAFGLPRFE